MSDNLNIEKEKMGKGEKEQSPPISSAPAPLFSSSAISRAARTDGHLVFAPTHIYEKESNGKTHCVGYASVNAIPMLTGWLSEETVSQEEGKAAIADLEKIALAQGCKFLLMPCTADCRFIEDMEKMGYRRGRRVTLFVKNL